MYAYYPFICFAFKETFIVIVISSNKTTNQNYDYFAQSLFLREIRYRINKNVLIFFFSHLKHIRHNIYM